MGILEQSSTTNGYCGWRRRSPAVRLENNCENSPEPEGIDMTSHWRHSEQANAAASSLSMNTRCKRVGLASGVNRATYVSQPFSSLSETLF